MFTLASSGSCQWIHELGQNSYTLSHMYDKFLAASPPYRGKKLHVFFTALRFSSTVYCDVSLFFAKMEYWYSCLLIVMDCKFCSNVATVLCSLRIVSPVPCAVSKLKLTLTKNGLLCGLLLYRIQSACFSMLQFSKIF